MTLVAFILAILAMFGQPSYVPPADFTTDALTRGTPTLRADFIGLTWPCADPGHDPFDGDDEECYAGLVFWDADAANGGPHWQLETGP